jgi:hypothetical protein
MPLAHKWNDRRRFVHRIASLAVELRETNHCMRVAERKNLENLRVEIGNRERQIL